MNRFRRPPPFLRPLIPEDAGAPAATHRFAAAALDRHKREGMELAIRARWAALAVIAVMLPFIDPTVEVLYYEALIGLMALNGWAQRRIARVERSKAEVALIFVDLMIMTAGIVVPNPLSENDWPQAMEFRDTAFRYFYIILAGAVLAYSWRTLTAIGVWTGIIWSAALLVSWALSAPDPALTAATAAAFGSDTELSRLMDPNNFMIGYQAQDIICFLLVALTLGLSVRRYTGLLHGHAALERERANLARYFSPNVVEELSHNDEPLKRIRSQDVAVLFVDIVGFTPYAAGRSPEEVIVTLRDFHQRMEREVFRHGGTLDKYLGDGLMATFGTPLAGERDATNALACARAMALSADDWNVERATRGEPPIRASFGLHFGPVVLGDIGASRLEFAVIGNTVNVASRVEALTRKLDCRIAATEDVVARVREESGEASGALAGLRRGGGQEIRGLDGETVIWTHE